MSANITLFWIDSKLESDTDWQGLAQIWVTVSDLVLVQLYMNLKRLAPERVCFGRSYKCVFSQSPRLYENIRLAPPFPWKCWNWHKHTPPGFAMWGRRFRWVISFGLVRDIVKGHYWHRLDRSGDGRRAPLRVILCGLVRYIATLSALRCTRFHDSWDAVYLLTAELGSTGSILDCYSTV